MKDFYAFEEEILSLFSEKNEYTPFISFLVCLWNIEEFRLLISTIENPSRTMKNLQSIFENRFLNNKAIWSLAEKNYQFVFFLIRLLYILLKKKICKNFFHNSL